MLIREKKLYAHDFVPIKLAKTVNTKLQENTHKHEGNLNSSLNAKQNFLTRAKKFTINLSRDFGCLQSFPSFKGHKSRDSVPRKK